MRRRSMVLRTSTLCRRKGSSACSDRRERNGAAFFSPPPVSSRTSSREISICMPKLSWALQIVDNHVGEVMDVDDDIVDAEGAQAGQRDFEQGAAGDFDQRFGAIVGERTQARAEAGGQNHRLHSGSVLLQFAMTQTTSTPLRSRRCCANCSARKTERCWPPVQPNETIRCLKPRRWYS